MSMICSVAVLAATNSEAYVAVSTVVCFLEYRLLSHPTGDFTGPSVGHNYLRKNDMNLPIGALNRSLQDLSIGI